MVSCVSFRKGPRDHKSSFPLYSYQVVRYFNNVYINLIKLINKLTSENQKWKDSNKDTRYTLVWKSRPILWLLDCLRQRKEGRESPESWQMVVDGLTTASDSGQLGMSRVGSLLSLQMACCSSHGYVPLMPLSLLIKTRGIFDWGPMFMTSFNLNYLFKSFVQIQSHSEVLEVRISSQELWGSIIQAITLS